MKNKVSKKTSPGCEHGLEGFWVRVFPTKDFIQFSKME